MIQKINLNFFIIKDSEIINFIRVNKIEHIRFDINIDECVHIVASYPDYRNLLSFEKRWFKIHWRKNSVCVRTPSILKDHVGEEIEIRREKIFSNDRELFKIIPVGFDIKDFRIKKKRIRINVPYFSKSGYCTIPKDYIEKRNISNIFICKLSFNRIDCHLVERGFIFARILIGSEPGGLIYSLKPCDNGMKTRSMRGVLDIISENNKNIMNFQYEKTVYDNKYNYDLIIFKEVDLNGN